MAAMAAGFAVIQTIQELLQPGTVLFNAEGVPRDKRVRQFKTCLGSRSLRQAETNARFSTI